MIRVEVVYAAAERIARCPLELPVNATVLEAVRASGVLDAFPEIDLARQRVGIYGKVVPLEQTLADGDRVEIYRLLTIEPKEARRLRAAKRRNGSQPGPD